MSDTDDWEFIFDGVFGFLSSPLWSVPMMTFIDSQSVVFEPTEENHLEWTSIHERYRALVESLLTSYLQDVGITEEQFMKACVSQSAQRSLAMQAICEQLFAGEDFEIFKKMMIQRNVELELEALNLIQRRQGKKKQAPLPSTHTVTEDEIIREVMKRSEEEYNEELKKRNAESSATYDANMEKMISESTETERVEQDVIVKQEETKRVVQESLKKEEESSTAPTSTTTTTTTTTTAATATQQQAEETKPASPPPSSDTPTITTTPPEQPPSSQQPPAPSPSKKSPVPRSPSPVLAPLKNNLDSRPLPAVASGANVTSSEDAASQWMRSAKEENETSSTNDSRLQKNAGLSADDLKKREEYLKEQRNRIMKMKNQEREKQLATYTQKGPQRPTSARVARGVVAGDSTSGAATGGGGAPVDAKKEKELAMRRVLADRLKREVVYK